MKFCFVRFCLLIALSACSKSILADTWFVRADGAPHYSPNIQNLSWRGLSADHSCDGKHDAAFPAIGTTNVLGQVSDGVNQPCALSDWRWLYDDQGSYNKLGWIISGGDTVILDNTKQWRVGIDGNGLDQGSQPWCWGYNGGPYGCFNPTVPAGTPSQHTRILGRNYQACSNADGTVNRSQTSQLFGGNAVTTALNLTAAQYVDVGCLEITQHATCIRHGSPSLPKYCNNDFTQGQPLDDYDSEGIITNVSTHDVALQNLWIHGHTDRGIIGSLGGVFTASGVDISTNGMAGWDFDDGQRSDSGVLKMDHSLIEFSGCNQAADGTVATCYSQSTGGYGDGIGTPETGMDVYIDHSVFRYNTQDGPDFVHVNDGNHVLQFTNNRSYGNSGASLKFGSAFKTALIANNVLVANCLRMSVPLGGTAPNYNAYLSDFCRAQNGFGFGTGNGAHITFTHNDLIGYAPTLVDPSCGDSNCSNTVFTFTDNIVRGYDNPTTYNMGGKNGGPGLFCGYTCDGSPAPLGTFVRSNNLYFGTRSDKQVSKSTGYAITETATNEMGGIDPMFVNEPQSAGSSFNETDLDGYNLTLGSGSPAVGAGISVAEVTTDLTGALWLAPPSVGALEYTSSATLASPSSGTFTAAPVAPAGPVATTTLLSGSSFVSYFENVTLTASVSPLSGGAVPSGTVTIYFGTYPLGSADLDKSGTARFVFPAVVEKLGVTASFSGSSAFLSSSSSILNSNVIVSQK